MIEPKAYYIDFELGCPYYKKGILDREPKNDAGREPDLICWFKGPVCKRPYSVEPKEVCIHCPASFHITGGFTDVSDSSFKKYHEFADSVHLKKQAALAAVASMADTQSEEFLKKAREIIGEEKVTVYEVLQDVARAKDLGGINMTTENKESVSFDDMLRSVDEFMEALFGPRGEEADDEPKNEVNEEECPCYMHGTFEDWCFGPLNSEVHITDKCLKCKANPCNKKNDQEAKADAGKAQLSLVPQAIIYDIARIREYGNAKYPEGGKDNWKSVEKQRYVDAMLRHISAYISDPEGVDEESGFPHLWHAACNMAFILEMEDEE